MTDAAREPDGSLGPDSELQRPDAGPRRTTSLRSRHLPLASPTRQIGLLESLDLEDTPHAGDFGATVRAATGADLTAGAVEILQINLGKLCNMTCRHCHVDAGPDRWAETMDRATAEACLGALDRCGARTVDLTGGAPELNPSFRWLVDQCASRGVHVMDRCNLTVLLLGRCADLPEFFAERRVEVVCSLPHYRRRSTDAQRGDGTFEKSIAALARLNRAGYGQGDPQRRLTLVVNPTGAFLAGNQGAMEREWKEGLRREHGVGFDRLITLNDMPIARYLEWLEASGNTQRYMELLVRSFNPGTVAGLMCRNTLSVGWDGRLYDCDFNQMLELEVEGGAGAVMDVRSLDSARLEGRKVVTGRHCFGCTAGAGSSCGGALDG